MKTVTPGWTPPDRWSTHASWFRCPSLSQYHMLHDQNFLQVKISIVWDSVIQFHLPIYKQSDNTVCTSPGHCHVTPVANGESITARKKRSGYCLLSFQSFVLRHLVITTSVTPRNCPKSEVATAIKPKVPRGLLKRSAGLDIRNEATRPTSKVSWVV